MAEEKIRFMNKLLEGKRLFVMLVAACIWFSAFFIYSLAIKRYDVAFVGGLWMAVGFIGIGFVKLLTRCGMW
jgi:multidrug transporter EmrE-like cation transporter